MINGRLSIPGSLLIVVFTLIAYMPAMLGGFIWDDDTYVTNNPTLTEAHGLWRIWLEPRSTPQYYPLTFTTFYLEHRLWGFEPIGYHAVNVLLHAANAMMLWFVLRTLGVPGSWLAASLFAVHPLEVESVAWVTERKNTLSGFFAIAALAAYLRFQPLEPNDRNGQDSHPRWGWYGLSISLYVLALLSKSVTAMLAAVALLLLWWKRPRLRMRDLLPLVPCFILGAAFGWNSARLEVEHVGARGPDYALAPFDRLLVAGRALWFYLGKLIAPANLTFIYPRWRIDPRQLSDWLPVFAAVSVVVILFLLRHRLGKGPLVAVLCYCAMLFPVLGFLNVYPMRYSFVADHFQYHAGTAMLALIAAAATQLFPGLEKRPCLALAAALPILAVLGCLTWSRCLVYRDQVSLWTDTVARNPRAWMAHTNLANLLVDGGRHEDALAHYIKAVELRPYDMQVYLNFGAGYLMTGSTPRAIEMFRRGLECPNGAPDLRSKLENNLGSALVTIGDIDGAVRFYRQAIDDNPLNSSAHSNLGKVLASLGRNAEAKEHYQIALHPQPK